MIRDGSLVGGKGRKTNTNSRNAGKAKLPGELLALGFVMLLLACRGFTT